MLGCKYKMLEGRLVNRACLDTSYIVSIDKINLVEMYLKLGFCHSYNNFLKSIIIIISQFTERVCFSDPDLWIPTTYVVCFVLTSFE